MLVYVILTTCKDDINEHRWLRGYGAGLSPSKHRFESGCHLCESLAEGHLAKVIMRHHTLACINTNSSVKKHWVIISHVK